LRATEPLRNLPETLGRSSPRETSLGSEFHSSQFALAFAMGVGAYIGVLHLWLWGRRDGGAPHSWVALFCLGSLGFQAARYLQLGTGLPEVALDPLAARVHDA